MADGAEDVGNPFYDMAPDWGVAPLAVLATMATVIASQALISGAFSLTAQAVRLDYFPRLAVHHTSSAHVGQVYVPLVNWLLMIGCVGLVLVFRTSSALASAYGIAVTTTMLITTLIFYRVVRDRWQWSLGKALVVTIPFLVVDLAFLGANIPKIPQGGWLPLLIGFGLVLQMTTWRRGRQLVAARLHRAEHAIESLPDEIAERGIHRVEGTAVYLSKDAAIAPPALLANLRHQKVLHDHVLVVSVDVAERPNVAHRKRARITHVGAGIDLVRIEFGFMDEPDVPLVLGAVDALHDTFDSETRDLLPRERIGDIGQGPGDASAARRAVRAPEPRCRQRRTVLPPSSRPGHGGRHAGHDLVPSQ